MKTPCTTPQALVRAFGGPAAVKELLSLSTTSAISNWNKRGIPAQWHYVLAEEAKARRIKVSKDLFKKPRKGRAAK